MVNGIHVWGLFASVPTWKQAAVGLAAAGSLRALAVPAGPCLR